MTAPPAPSKDFLPEGHLRVLAFEYQLEKWIGGKKRLAERQRKWFEIVDDLYGGIRHVHRSGEKQDGAVRDLLVDALEEDGTFRDYLLELRSTELAHEEAWDKARLAMAGLIMNLHAQACATGEWLPGRSGQKAA
jgi:hypothetical protein